MSTFMFGLYILSVTIIDLGQVEPLPDPLGEDSGPDARVPAAMLTAAIGGAVMHPLVVDFDDETLRVTLLRLARRFLDMPD